MTTTKTIAIEAAMTTTTTTGHGDNDDDDKRVHMEDRDLASLQEGQNTKSIRSQEAQPCACRHKRNNHSRAHGFKGQLRTHALTYVFMHVEANIQWKIKKTSTYRYACTTACMCLIQRCRYSQMQISGKAYMKKDTEKCCDEKHERMQSGKCAR